MTTPAQNISISVTGNRNVKVYDLAGVLLSNQDSQIIRTSYRRSRPESVNNPKRADGTRAPSANWTSWGGRSTSPTGFLEIQSSTARRVIRGVIARAQSPTVYMQETLADLERTAVRKALGQWGEDQMRLNTALREVRHTAKQLADYYRGTSRMLGRVTEGLANKNFKKRMRDYKHGWKEAPSQYLGYLYGMRPLAEDVERAAAKLSEAKTRGLSMRIYLHGNHTSRATYNQSLQTTTGYSAVQHQLHVYQAKAALCFKLPDWFLDNYQPVTFFSEAYELTRLSFVLDWVWPLGSWIRGMEGLQLMPFFTEGSTTVFSRITGNAISVKADPGWAIKAQNVSYQGAMYQLVRRNVKTLTGVGRLPSLRSPLKLSYLDDAAGLAGQAFAKLSRAIDS